MSYLAHISDRIANRKGLRTVKPLLHVLFVACITYSVMLHLYPEEIIPKTFEWDRIVRYLLSGDFIVPLSIFFMLWAITGTTGALFDNRMSNWGSKLSSKISKIQFIEDKATIVAEELSSAQISATAKRNWAVRLYEASLKYVEHRNIEEIDLKLKRASLDLVDSFVLVIRSIIASILFLNQVPHFGWGLFLLLLLFQLFSIAALVIGFLFTFLLPIVARKFKKEHDEYERMKSMVTK
jgi:hypothetical protein